MSAIVTLFVRIVDYGECCVCGVNIAGPSDHKRNRLDDRKPFFCINGHSQSYIGKTELQKLQERLDAETARRARAEEGRARDAERSKRAIASERGKMTKLRNRVGNGVCPCCNRTFQNLMGHMKTQHPEFKDPELAPVAGPKRRTS